MLQFLSEDSILDGENLRLDMKSLESGHSDETSIPFNV